MKFEWDNNKNLSNIEKHGISFEEAKSIFSDSFAIINEDKRFEYGETRFVIIGKIYLDMINKHIISTVVCTKREDKIRIISARKASRKERKLYE
jgi:uncharacterized DUF497 family protein